MLIKKNYEYKLVLQSIRNNPNLKREVYQIQIVETYKIEL